MDSSDESDDHQALDASIEASNGRRGSVHMPAAALLGGFLVMVCACGTLARGVRSRGHDVRAFRTSSDKQLSSELISLNCKGDAGGYPVLALGSRPAVGAAGEGEGEGGEDGEGGGVNAMEHGATPLLQGAHAVRKGNRRRKYTLSRGLSTEGVTARGGGAGGHGEESSDDLDVDQCCSLLPPAPATTGLTGRGSPSQAIKAPPPAAKPTKAPSQASNKAPSTAVASPTRGTKPVTGRARRQEGALGRSSPTTKRRREASIDAHAEAAEAPPYPYVLEPTAVSVEARAFVKSLARRDAPHPTSEDDGWSVLMPHAAAIRF